jgi:predicted DsbA family dithiol-disulfide isomerase
LTADRQHETYNVELYYDYTCPTSWAAERWLAAVRRDLGDRLHITRRAFPLEQVNMQDPTFNVWDYPNDGSSSTMRAFQAAWAARQQGEDAYERMHALLYVRRHAEGRNLAGQRVLEQTAEEAGLDIERFRADLTSNAAFQTVREDYLHGKHNLGVFGCPTLVFDNGRGAYLRFTWDDARDDAVAFFHEFVTTVRDREHVYEIKRPLGPQPVGV